jgi:hypothetical protein
MQRWQEQAEQKLAELLRTAESFKKMQDIWTHLARRQEPGFVAYAKQKAAMYGKMVSSSDEGLVCAGYAGLRARIEKDEISLLDVVEKHRLDETWSIDADDGGSVGGLSSGIGLEGVKCVK